MMDRLRTGALILTLSVIVLFLGWSFWPYHVIELKQLTTLQAEATQGDSMYMRLDYCKEAQYAGTPGSVRYAFIDGLIQSASGGSRELLPFGCKSMKEGLQVPDTLPPGEYRIEMTRTYRVNPVRTISVSVRSNEFTVIQRQPPELSADLLRLLAANRDLITANAELQRQNHGEIERLRLANKTQAKTIEELEQRLNDLKVTNKLKEPFAPRKAKRP